MGAFDMLAQIRTAQCVVACALALAAPLAAQSSEAIPTAAQQARRTPLVEVVEAVGPAVVNIFQQVTTKQSLPWPYSQIYPATRTSTSLGSGVIIDAEGFILTNAHVFDPRGPIQVQMTNGRGLAARVVQIDAANDVALLKVSSDEPLPTAHLGISSDIMVGETVVAIGNPLGNSSTVTSGIVSAVFRDVAIPGTSGGRYRDFIQLDAPINPGNSGGPLLNVLGEVIGINWAIATDAEGIGFAIPIDRVRESLSRTLFNPAVLANVSTGMAVAEVDGALTLSGVEPGGPAAQAGLRVGDQLLSMAGRSMGWEFDYNKVLYYAEPGDEVELLVQRGQSQVQARLQLEAEESPLQAIERLVGLRVVDHPRFQGVLIEAVDPRGPAARLPLLPGDHIDGFAGADVNDTTDLYRALSALQPGQRAWVNVFRQGRALRGRLLLE